MNREAIQAEYERLGYKAGWSFMYTPAARLHDAEIALVGLNPGGDEGDAGHWDHPEGNAYANQNWSANGKAWSPLQVQVAALLDAVGVRHDRIVATQFIPFRSPNWRELERKKEALAFGRQLWRWLLEQTTATRFLCLGSTAAEELARLTGAKRSGKFKTDWGNQTFDRYVSPRHTVVRIPHLSRYRVFDRGGNHDAVVRSAIKAASAPP